MFGYPKEITMITIKNKTVSREEYLEMQNDVTTRYPRDIYIRDDNKELSQEYTFVGTWGVPGIEIWRVYGREDYPSFHTISGLQEIAMESSDRFDYKERLERLRPFDVLQLLS